MTNLFGLDCTFVIEPLSDEFNRRLSSVDLESRHVEIINKEDELLAERRTKHALPSLVQLAVDDVL